VDRYVANSHLTAARVRRYLGRESTVVHPPVELERFAPAAPGEVGEHYLVLAELMAHKRIDVAVRAFAELGLPLIVVGDGPEARHLRRLATPNVTFAGRAGDQRVAELLRTSRALVVTAAEEFGIAAVEALASGRPVIALGSGGVLESVVEGETGDRPGRVRGRGPALRDGALPGGAPGDRRRGRGIRARAAQRSSYTAHRVGGARQSVTAPGRLSRPHKRPVRVISHTRVHIGGLKARPTGQNRRNSVRSTALCLLDGRSPGVQPGPWPLPKRSHGQGTTSRRIVRPPPGAAATRHREPSGRLGCTTGRLVASTTGSLYNPDQRSMD
jgi:hypothetical protein